MAYEEYIPEQSLSKKLIAWLGGGLAFLFGKVMGVVFLIPLVLSLIIIFVVRKMCKASYNATIMEGLVIGHTGWFIIGAILAPTMLNNVALDVLISLALILWMIARLSLLPIVILLAYEVISLVVNVSVLMNSEASSVAFKALIVHCLWRVMIIGFAIAHLVGDRRQTEGVPMSDCVDI